VGPRWSSGPLWFLGLSSTLPPDDRVGAVLIVLASVFGDQCKRVLRVCAATGTTLGEALVDLSREWGVGRIDNPTPSCLKLMCREVAVAVELLPPRGEEALVGDLLDFLAMDCAVVRRRYKHTQRWYVEMKLLDGAPPLLTRQCRLGQHVIGTYGPRGSPRQGTTALGYERPGDDSAPRGYLLLTSCRSTCGGRLSRACATHEVLGPHVAPRRTTNLASSTQSRRLGISTV
jgi:hypothetical protein